MHNYKKVLKFSKTGPKVEIIKNEGFDSVELLNSVIMKSNLLHWACMLDETKFDSEKVEAMLKNDWSYPECPNHLDNMRTPLHQAARYGNYDKLDLLLRNVNSRYCFCDHSSNEKSLKPHDKTDSLVAESF